MGVLRVTLLPDPAGAGADATYRKVVRFIRVAQIRGCDAQLELRVAPDGWAYGWERLPEAFAAFGIAVERGAHGTLVVRW